MEILIIKKRVGEERKLVSSFILLFPFYSIGLGVEVLCVALCELVEGEWRRHMFAERQGMVPKSKMWAVIPEIQVEIFHLSPQAFSSCCFLLLLFIYPPFSQASSLQISNSSHFLTTHGHRWPNHVMLLQNAFSIAPHRLLGMEGNDYAGRLPDVQSGLLCHFDLIKCLVWVQSWFCCSPAQELSSAAHCLHHKVQLTFKSLFPVLTPLQLYLMSPWVARLQPSWPLWLLKSCEIFPNSGHLHLYLAS